MFSGGTAWAARSARRFRALLARTRAGIQELSAVAAVTLVTGYLLFEVDVFSTEGQGTLRHQEIELDEVLIFGGVLTLGLLVFAVRRLHEQQQEMRRRAAAERSARELALRDALTGLPNRRRFDDALKAAVGSPPGADAVHAVMMLDLNGFKEINDVYGHAAGDEALCVVGRRLATAVRDGDMVARFGGDEFAVLALHLAGAEAATGIALRMLEALGRPIVIAGVSHDVGAGIGICMMPRQGADAEEVLRRADVALYRAKAEETSALRFFDEEMDRHIRERDELQRELRAAIDAGAIRPLFQPLVDLRTKEVVAFEALPHWEREGAAVPPERFMSIAEDCGLIHELTERLLRTACRAALEWPAGVILSFNVSPLLVRDRMIGLRVLAVLAKTGLPPHRLEIEIPESALVRDMEAAQAVLGALKECGVRLALDEFGTGYSSLYHLQNFKLDRVKLDRSFVESLGPGGEGADVVGALIGLGRGLGLTVTAEGIQEDRQESALLAKGCSEGQGGLFGAAVPAEVARALCEPAPPRLPAAAVAAG
jgi:diguanylate cyclase (GGDEF)-like protein